MKEKNKTIADKNSKRSIQDLKKRNPFRSDQAVDSENKEKIRKIFMKKFPIGPVHEQADNIEPGKSGKSDKKQGSHSLSALHFFQNHHR